MATSTSDQDTTVKVAVRIRPLNEIELLQDSSICLDVIPGRPQIRAGENSLYTFDHVFGIDTAQENLYEGCVSGLLNAAFEGFNATILAYGQTGSGKTYTMGSSADIQIAEESHGIIPRVIRNLFDMIQRREEEDPRSSYKVHVQFLELYGEDIRDLLDQTRTSKVAIREMRSGEVFVTGAREEYVTSFEQMMKALEDGTRNRTTAATKMNQTSSRSHAIFTVILEHIILSDVESSATSPTEGVEEGVTQEVRKSKFHFVDLAGSERAKRTGAQGLQLKEGIDINKGLLALGNVISALGDETKRGKVYVPYRDSKLTRILQDSLGGNSKTLMICCVSPAAINYNESLNALRYANRARNIKNKPVVNRDPALLIIDELRSTLRAMAQELLAVRQQNANVKQIDGRLTTELLLEFANGSHGHGAKVFRQDSCDENSSSNSIPNAVASKSPTLARTMSSRTLSTSSKTGTSSGGGGKEQQELKRLSKALEEAQRKAADLQSQLRESDFELQRQVEQLKLSRQRVSESSDRLVLLQCERDYYFMRWADLCPDEAKVLELYHQQQGNKSDAGETARNGTNSKDSNDKAAEVIDEQERFMRMTSVHLKEIESLKEQLASEKARNSHPYASLSSASTNLVDEGPPELDPEFTSAMSSLLTQARSQLQEEARRLKALEYEDSGTATPGTGADTDDEHGSQEKKEMEIEKSFQRRQRLLSVEVQELGQSIVLKEQLVEQLMRSQQQYAHMKSFYQQRLTSLNEAMLEKQKERDQLAKELSELSSSATTSSSADTTSSVRESKLLDELRARDADLKAMKEKQAELQHLTQIPARYNHQLSRLQDEIVSMKKQRVDLSKTLQAEKKQHVAALQEKAREIQSLQRLLSQTKTELKKVGRDKELAENRVKDALREGALLKKKVQEATAKANVVSSSSSSTVPTTVASTLEALKAIHKSNQKSATGAGGNRRILTEQEVRTRRWLASRVTEICAREAAVDALKRQYEQQLDLLARKDALEKERSQAMESKGDNEAVASNEEESSLEILEDRLSSIDGQLHARGQQIRDIIQQINDNASTGATGEVMASNMNSEKLLESLKKMAASTLPASHDLIRVLLEMLVQTQQAAKAQSDRLADELEKEKQLTRKVEDLQEQMSNQQHGYDKEMTRLHQEYEERLHELFAHVTTLQKSVVASGGLGSASVDSHHVSHSSVLSSPLPPPPPTTVAVTQSTEKKRSSDPLELQLAIALQESIFTKNQLQREQYRFAQLQAQAQEAERGKRVLMREVDERRLQIRFLEEDRSLFKDMVEDLKTGLLGLGRAGKAVLESAKERVNQRRSLIVSSSGGNILNGGRRGIYNDLVTLSDDDDDDTKSILGEYECLGEEISRTGDVQAVKDFPSGGATIYDRLSNPSSYTGSMKAVFDNDIESKRKRTALIRTKEKGSRRDPAVFAPAPFSATPSSNGILSKRNADLSGKFFGDNNSQSAGEETMGEIENPPSSRSRMNHATLPPRSARHSHPPPPTPSSSGDFGSLNTITERNGGGSGGEDTIELSAAPSLERQRSLRSSTTSNSGKGDPRRNFALSRGRSMEDGLSGPLHSTLRITAVSSSSFLSPATDRTSSPVSPRVKSRSPRRPHSTGNGKVSATSSPSSVTGSSAAGGSIAGGQSIISREGENDDDASINTVSSAVL
eukprot:scaffold14367_cov250-Ochromonas_danica.AAC.7